MSSKFDPRETYIYLRRGSLWVKHGFLFVKARPSFRLSEAKLDKLQFPIPFKYNHSEGLIEESTVFGNPDEKYWSMNKFVLCNDDLNARSLRQ